MYKETHTKALARTHTQKMTRCLHQRELRGGGVKVKTNLQGRSREREEQRDEVMREASGGGEIRWWGAGAGCV